MKTFLKSIFPTLCNLRYSMVHPLLARSFGSLRNVFKERTKEVKGFKEAQVIVHRHKK